MIAGSKGSPRKGVGPWRRPAESRPPGYLSFQPRPRIDVSVRFTLRLELLSSRVRRALHASLECSRGCSMRSRIAHRQTCLCFVAGSFGGVKFSGNRSDGRGLVLKENMFLGVASNLLNGAQYSWIPSVCRTWGPDSLTHIGRWTARRSSRRAACWLPCARVRVHGLRRSGLRHRDARHRDRRTHSRLQRGSGNKCPLHHQTSNFIFVLDLR